MKVLTLQPDAVFVADEGEARPVQVFSGTDHSESTTLARYIRETQATV